MTQEIEGIVEAYNKTGDKPAGLKIAHGNQVNWYNAADERVDVFLQTQGKSLKGKTVKAKLNDDSKITHVEPVANSENTKRKNYHGATVGGAMKEARAYIHKKIEHSDKKNWDDIKKEEYFAMLAEATEACIQANEERGLI